MLDIILSEGSACYLELSLSKCHGLSVFPGFNSAFLWSASNTFRKQHLESTTLEFQKCLLTLPFFTSSPSSRMIRVVLNRKKNGINELSLTENSSKERIVHLLNPQNGTRSWGPGDDYPHIKTSTNVPLRIPYP